MLKGNLYFQQIMAYLKIQELTNDDYIKLV